jgi:hypothetical protein
VESGREVASLMCMDDPMTEDQRYCRAAYRGMWFGAAFALVCAALAALSWGRVIGEQREAPLLLLMTLVGVVLLILIRLVIHFVGR